MNEAANAQKKSSAAAVSPSIYSLLFLSVCLSLSLYPSQQPKAWHSNSNLRFEVTLATN